jgi:hypothetical protein
MIVKVIEIRDRGTFIPAAAIKTVWANEGQRYLLRRAGWPNDQVILVHLQNCRSAGDPYDWDDRTMQTAHVWLIEHFEELSDGAVVDVQFILGETAAPKVSERVEWPAP